MNFIAVGALGFLCIVLAFILAAVLVFRSGCAKVDRATQLRAYLAKPEARLEVAQRIREARLMSALESEREGQLQRIVDQELNHASANGASAAPAS